MLRLLIFLVGMLSTRRPAAVPPRQGEPDEDATWFLPPRPERPPRPYAEPRTLPLGPERRGRRWRVCASSSGLRS